MKKNPMLINFFFLLKTLMVSPLEKVPLTSIIPAGSKLAPFLKAISAPSSTIIKPLDFI